MLQTAIYSHVYPGNQFLYHNASLKTRAQAKFNTIFYQISTESERDWGSSYCWYENHSWVPTLKILKIRTPKKFAVITLKFEQGGFSIE